MHARSYIADPCPNTARLLAIVSATVLLWGCSMPPEAANFSPAVEQISGTDAAAGTMVTHGAGEVAAAGVRYPAVGGNRVALLLDGPQTYDDMFAQIAAAEDHINLETFILADDVIGRRLADALAQRAAQGVVVNVIYDAIGSMGTDDDYFDTLRARGVNLLAYRPMLETEPTDWHNRNHRKVLVIDGKTGFTGGLNFAEVYRFSSEDTARGGRFGDGWRDTHVKITGPAVAVLQEAFLRMWTECAEGDPIVAANYFPKLQATGNASVKIVTAVGDDEEGSRIIDHYLSSINSARTRAWLTQAYFAPEDEVLDALTNAARRGVDVRLILPRTSDVEITVPAARALYTEMLEAGVRVYEYQTGVLHAKTALIDDDWATVGSSNLDALSSEFNNELNAVIRSRDFNAALAAAFHDDLSESREIILSDWRERGLWARLKENLAQLLQPVL